MSRSRVTTKITERVWSGCVHSLFSKARSPPYCCAVLLDPYMYPIQRILVKREIRPFCKERTSLNHNHDYNFIKVKSRYATQSRNRKNELIPI